MCRIAGIVTKEGGDDVEALIGSMTDAMRRGGPDDSGSYIDTAAGLALGHRRLSILDLTSAGHQPMWTSDGSIAIVFNGEIYNFLELKEALITLGASFHTQTDTEVILQAFKHWGNDCFHRFNGMFALAIYDKAAGEIILARDASGIKPLYYSINEKRLVFASEMRAFNSLPFHWEADECWRGLFLMFGHLPEPYTTLKHVRTLEKGCLLRIRIATLEHSITRYHSPAQRPAITDEDEALSAIQQSLTAAVKRHLISDAPIGLFLSGGIDSSILTIIAARFLPNRLHTLSINFDEQAFSEAVYQQLVIEVTGAQHHSFSVRQPDFEQHFPDILAAIDQPSIDAINTYFVCKYAKEGGFKAVLSGLGGDELFGGYPSFARYNKFRQLRKLRGVLPAIAPLGNRVLSKLSFIHLPHLLSLYLLNRGLFPLAQAAALSGVQPQQLLEACNGITAVQQPPQHNIYDNVRIEQEMYMQNQLLKDADYMSMWHGVEVRVPFLDKDFLTTVNAIDPALRFRNHIQKELLVRAFFPVLPTAVWNRQKQGFTFPFEQWLKASEYFSPANDTEKKIYSFYKDGKLHWSRYWAVKLMSAVA